jgi:hypothetical protein
LGCPQLIVAADGRLGLPAFKRLARPNVAMREVRSGRELISPLLAMGRAGWLEWLRGWFQG